MLTLPVANEPPPRAAAPDPSGADRVLVPRRSRAEYIAAEATFCEVYAATGRQSDAARAAFPELASKSDDAAVKRGRRLLRRPEIAAAVRALHQGPPTFAHNAAARAALAGMPVEIASAPPFSLAPVCADRTPPAVPSTAVPDADAADAIRRGMAVALDPSAPDLDRLLALRAIAAELDEMRRARAPGDDVVIAVEIRIGARGATSARLG